MRIKGLAHTGRVTIYPRIESPKFIRQKISNGLVCYLNIRSALNARDDAAPVVFEALIRHKVGTSAVAWIEAGLTQSTQNASADLRPSLFLEAKAAMRFN
jgi:hypothetical protein